MHTTYFRRWQVKETILERYVEMYSSGDVNAENYMACANYLKGYRDGLGDVPVAKEFDRIIATLGGAANLICWLRRTGNGNG